MGKINGFLFTVIGFIATIFLANLQGKKKGRQEEQDLNNRSTINDVKSASKIKAKNSKLTKSDIISGL